MGTRVLLVGMQKCCGHCRRHHGSSSKIKTKILKIRNRIKTELPYELAFHSYIYTQEMKKQSIKQMLVPKQHYSPVKSWKQPKNTSRDEQKQTKFSKMNIIQSVKE